jgi:multiple sugar transport system permease protein
MNLKEKTTFYTLVIVILLWVLLPLFFITISTFTPQKEIYAWPKPLVPSKFSAETLLFFLKSHGVIPSLLNSIIVALLTLILTTLISAPAGYAITRFSFKGKDTFRMGILLIRMFPVPLLAIPLAVTFIKWKLYDTLIGVAFVHTAMAVPFAVIITSAIFAGVPEELEEAAIILGCGRLKAFLKVSLPLALPGLAATAMFTFVTSWNEVFAASILTLNSRTLPAHILVTLNASPLYFRFAGGFFMIIPAIIFIFFMRKYLFHMWGIRAGK